MGFLSKLARSNMPISKRRSSPRPGALYRKPILGVPAERTIEGIPISQLPFNPRMPGKLFPFPRIPKSKKRGGFGGSLREAIRRLKEQRDMGMPRMPSMDFGDQIGYKRPNKNPDAIAFDNPSFRMIGTPQPIPRAERMPISNAPSFNPTIFGQPIGDMDFSNMPDFSQIDLTNLQVPNQMPMAQDLPEVASVGMMPQMRMDGMQDMQPRMMMAEGDEVSFPDLTGDGKVTQADILKGRGVYAEGDEVIMEENEIDAMLGGMDSEEAGAMEDLEQMAPEMEMIDQLVTMVVQMIQQGASEEEVMMFLREQGLDDEDIGTVLQLVAEMAEAEAMPQDGIGAELEQLV